MVPPYLWPGGSPVGLDHQRGYAAFLLFPYLLVIPSVSETPANSMSKSVDPRQPQQYSCSVDELQDMVMKFTAWLEKAGYASYDPYDIWGTQYGLWTRRLYYAKHPLGVVLAAPVLLMEMLCPSLRALFVKKV